MTRHPHRDPTPAGATDAGVGVRSRNAAVRRSLPEFAGTGTTARPVEGIPPAGATDAGGSPKLISATAYRQRHEPRVVTLFHAKQHGALSFSPRACDHACAHRLVLIQICRQPRELRHRSRSRGPRRPRTESTPVTTTPSLPAPATRAAGARVRPSLARSACVIRLVVLGPRFFGVRQFAERQVDGLFRTLVHDGQLHRGLRAPTLRSFWRDRARP